MSTLQEILGDRYGGVIDKAARAMADPSDSCFEDLDYWNARPDWDRSEDAAWTESIDSTMESVHFWHAAAEASLAAVLPDLLAKATLEGFERAKVETEAAIKPVIRAAMHHAWQEGVATTLDHAIRNPDGITLRLEHLDGRPWASPYAPEEGS